MLAVPALPGTVGDPMTPPMTTARRHPGPTVSGLTLARRRPAGFTLIEVIVVIVLIGALLAVVIPRLGNGTGAATDASAQTTAEAALDAVVVNHSRTGTLAADPATLATIQPEITYKASSVASTAPTDASVAAAGEVVGVAVAAGAACWFVRHDFAAAPGNPTVTHAARPSGPTPACTGAAALAVAPTAGRGASWSRPVLVP